MPLLARCAILTIGYNKSKEIFANPKGKEHELIRIFISTKVLIGWNLLDTATVCRERCGGGGFLSNNRIIEGRYGAHSGMTAEGDNRVLMQKVVKDILTDS